MTTFTADPRVKRMLADVARVVSPDVSYGIGGAVAMAARGYARYTSDLDLFVTEADAPTVLRALRGAGYRVSEVFDRIHYAAYPPGDVDPDVRIDVLVPYDEPDFSVADGSEPLEVDGATVLVATATVLALQKFCSDRDGDARDLRAMYKLGVFDPELVRLAITHIDDPERSPEMWDALRARWDAPGAPPRRRR